MIFLIKTVSFLRSASFLSIFSALLSISIMFITSRKFEGSLFSDVVLKIFIISFKICIFKGSKHNFSIGVNEKNYMNYELLREMCFELQQEPLL